jgi:hypothetical protein
VESQELHEADELIAKGDLKKALKRIEVARKKALGAQDLDLMQNVLAAAEKVNGEATGSVRDNSQKQIKTIEWNLNFLQGKTPMLGTPPPPTEGSPEPVVAAQPQAGTLAAYAGADSFTVRGRNGQLTVTPTKLVISREGAMGFLSHGHSGHKEIDLRQISAVQFKRNGLATAGYIQFSFLGGTETKQGIRDATRDENSIIFGKGREADFVKAKELIDEYRAALLAPPATTPPPPPTSTPSVAEELERLAALRDKGILDDEEFNAQKRKILGL